MPKLWNDTIEAHRQEVREAILETTATLVAEHGLRAVTMSQIAERTGIGRATLYKYFADVEAILVAWHDRHVTAHLEHLAAIRDQSDDPRKRLETMLRGYAQIVHGRAQQSHGADLLALVHRDEHIAQAQRQIRELIHDAVTAAAVSGDIRDDIPPHELTDYCIHALAAAAEATEPAAIQRLVNLTLGGLRSTAAGSG